MTEDQDIRGALGRTQTLLDADLDAARKKEIRGIAVLSCLIVFAVSYMTWLYTQLGKLDASVLTGVAGARAAQSLPEMKKRLTDELVKMAPDLMADAEKFILKTPARLRADVEKLVVEEARGRIRKVEEELDQHLTKSLQESINLLQQTEPNAPPEMAFDLLLARVRDDYRTGLMAQVEGMHSDSKAQFDRLHDYLARLQAGDSLTEQEQLDKELIQTWVVLVDKHHITTPEVK